MYNQPWSPYHPLPASNPRNTLEVMGEGIVSAAPDKAVVVLGAVTENVNLTAAQQENASAMTRVIDALLKLSMPKERIQTTQYTIDIVYDYEDGKQQFRGYRVTHLLQVTVEQVEQTGVVVDTAVRNGANTVSSIRFALANPETAYTHALSRAIQQARLKAVSMAKALGVTLQPVPFLVEEMSRTAEPIPYAAAAFAKQEATPIQPGELSITASVKAQFTYQ